MANEKIRNAKKYNANAASVIRNHKDTLFKRIFSDKDNDLELNEMRPCWNIAGN